MSGTKASGTVSVKNCEDTDGRSNSAGTGFASASGRTFVSTKAADVPKGSFSGGGSVCSSATVPIDVTAAENGDSYNIAPTSYTSSALSGNFIISGNQMSGGSSKTVAVVTQADFDSARKDFAPKRCRADAEGVDRSFWPR